MSTLATLAVRYTGDTSSFMRAAREVEQRASTVERSVGVMAKAVGAAFVVAGVAVAGFTAKGVGDFAAFDTKMREVFTLMPGITGEAMTDMTGQVEDFSRQFGVLPTEVVPALYQSLSAGVPADNVFAFLETAQKAARGGVTDLTTAVNGISSVVNAYGKDVLSATLASDVMFTGVRLGKTTFDELSRSLFNVVPTAASLGIQFGDVTAALATMTGQGIPTSVATTQLRQAFVELSKQGTEADKAFRNLAGVGFKEYIAQGHNVGDAMRLLQEGAAEQGISIADLFGSVEAGQAALALTGNNMGTFVNNLGEMGAAAGATNGAFEVMQGGIGVSFDKLRAAGANFLLNIGAKLAPTVKTAVDAIVAAMPAFEEAVARGGAALFDLGARAAAMVGPVVAAARTLFDAFRTGDFNAAFGPILAAFEAVFGAGTRDMVVMTVSNVLTGFQRVRDTVITVAQALSGNWVDSDAISSPFVRGAGNIATSIREFILGDALPAVQRFGGWFMETGLPAIRDFAGQAQTFITGTLVPAVTGFVNSDALPALRRFGDWFMATGLPAIRDFAGQAQAFITGTLVPAITGFVSGDALPALQRFGDWFTAVGVPALQGFGDAALPVIQRIADFIRDNFPAIAKTVAVAVAAFAGFTILTTIGGWIASAVAVWGTLSAAITSAGGVVAAVVAVLGGPLTLAIAAVVAVVALLAAAWVNNWGDIHGKVAAVWAWLQPVLGQLGDRLAEFGATILPALTAAWSAASEKIADFAGTVGHVVQTVFGAVGDFLAEHGDQIKAVLMGAWTVISTLVNTQIRIVSNVIQVVLAVISGDWQGAWDKLMDISTAVWDLVVVVATKGGELLKNVLQLLWGAITTVAQTAWGALTGWIEEQWHRFTAGIVEQTGLLRDGVAAKWDDMTAAVTAFITVTVPGVFRGGLAAVKSAAMAIFEGGGSIAAALDQWVTARLTDVQRFIGTDIPNTFTGAIQAVRSAAMRIFEGAGSVGADLTAWFTTTATSAGTFITTTIPNTFTGAVQAVQGAFMGIFTGLLPTAGTGGQLYNWFTQAVFAVDTFIGAHIPGKFSEKYEQVRAAFMNVWTSFLDAAGNGTLGAWFTTAVTSIGNFIGTTIPERIGAFASRIGDAIKAPFTGAAEAMNGIFTTLVNTVIRGVNEAGRRVRDFANAIRGIVNWISNKLGAGDVMSDVYNWSDIEKISGLARGTDHWRGGWAVVGEEGFELARLPAGAQVIPHEQSVAMWRAGLFSADTLSLSAAKELPRGVDAPGGERVPGFAGGLNVMEALRGGAQWVLDRAVDAAGGFPGLALDGALREIGTALVGKAKDWALAKVTDMVGRIPRPSAPSGAQGYAATGWGSPSAAQLNARIDGGGRALAGMGDYILGAAGRYGVPATVFMGILEHESAYGAPYDGLTRYNNFTGLTGTDWPGQTGTARGMARPFAIFDSRESGINAALENLTTGLYRDRTLAEVLSMWLTGSYTAGVDPTHPQYTVADYLSHVDAVVQTLGGSYDPNRVVVSSTPPAVAPRAASASAGQAGYPWSGWSPPLDGYTITQEYGSSDINYRAGYHTGIDLAARHGAPIKAAAVGKVIDAGPAGGYGNAIKLDHGNAIESVYAHLDRVLVSAGELMDRGMGMGIQGNTGYSTGEHLHFEIRKGGADVNPRDYVAFADGGVIAEPIVGRGLRSGRSYTFGEEGREVVIPEGRMGDGRPAVETHYHYTLATSNPEWTVEQLKREQRREERLRGYASV